MGLLKKLGFIKRNTREDSQFWTWDDYFCITFVRPCEKSPKGMTKIYYQKAVGDIGDKRGFQLFSGFYIFDNRKMAFELLKNLGIVEAITKKRDKKIKKHNHHFYFSEYGFKQVTPCVFRKHFFQISFIAPKWEDEKGKCVILKKPQTKRSLKGQTASKLVYKGQYFFHNDEFVKFLFDKIAFYKHEEAKMHMNYIFTREKTPDGNSFIDLELLNF